MDEKKLEKVLLVTLISLSLCAYGLTIKNINKDLNEYSNTDDSEVACING